MERIIHSHLFSHLESLNILCEQQHGFRPRRSCESQLITTLNDITKTTDSGLQTDIIFLDLSKAFDKVPHYSLCRQQIIILWNQREDPIMDTKFFN